MIKENQKYFNRLHILLDAIVICIAYIFSYYVRFRSMFTDYFDSLSPKSFRTKYGMYYWPLNKYVYYLIYIIPLFLICYYLFHLYTPKRYQSKRYEFANIIKANLICLLILSTAFYIFGVELFSRSMLFIFVAINFIFALSFRILLRVFLNRNRKKGRNLKHIVIVGFGKAGSSYIDRIKANPQWGYKIKGIFDDNIDKDFEYRNIHLIGNIENLKSYLEKYTLDEVIITLNLDEYSKLENIVNICEKAGVHTKFVPDYYNFIATKPYIEDLNGLPVINIRNVPLTNTLNKFIKRVIDIFGSIVAIILFSPVMLVVGILVKTTSKGPVIYSQIRVGLNNKEFKMYKFRSMEIQNEDEEKSKWTKKNDPRVTKVGKFIRKTSIDEFPQFFNVLRGDMSLVGPRPERPFFVEKFKEEIPRYMIKHQVRPGITGWAQINGFRGDTSIRGRIEHDLYYIENWTLGLDFKILFLTVFKGFVNKNAY